MCIVSISLRMYLDFMQRKCVFSIISMESTASGMTAAKGALGQSPALATAPATMASLGASAAVRRSSSSGCVRTVGRARVATHAQLSQDVPLPFLTPLWLEAWQRQQSDLRLTSWRASHRRAAGLRFTSRLAAAIRRWWTG